MAACSTSIYFQITGLPWQGAITDSNIEHFQRAVYRGEPRSELERRIPSPDARHGIFLTDGGYYYIRRSQFCYVELDGFFVKFDRADRVVSWRREHSADGC